MKFTSKNKTEALSTKYHNPIIGEKMSASGLLIMSRNAIIGHDYQLMIKKKSSPKSSLTTTVPAARIIWLSHDWDSRPEASQALTLAHELVHVRQQLAMGPAKFLRRYATPRGRWVLEMQAYAETIRANRSLGFDVSDIPENVAKSMWKNYKPWLLFGKDEIIKSTIEVLSKV
jgi:hypothetical protein